MEYTIPFNADSMAANIVDTLREITDATLSSCIVGAEETCRLLKEHIKYVISLHLRKRMHLYFPLGIPVSYQLIRDKEYRAIVRERGRGGGA